MRHDFFWIGISPISDREDFLKSRTAFAKEWDKYTGLR